MKENLGFFFKKKLVYCWSIEGKRHKLPPEESSHAMAYRGREKTLERTVCEVATDPPKVEVSPGDKLVFTTANGGNGNICRSHVVIRNVGVRSIVYKFRTNADSLGAKMSMSPCMGLLRPGDHDGVAVFLDTGGAGRLDYVDNDLRVAVVTAQLEEAKEKESDICADLSTHWKEIPSVAEAVHRLGCVIIDDTTSKPHDKGEESQEEPEPELGKEESPDANASDTESPSKADADDDPTSPMALTPGVDSGKQRPRPQQPHQPRSPGGGGCSYFLDVRPVAATAMRSMNRPGGAMDWANVCQILLMAVMAFAAAKTLVLE